MSQQQLFDLDVPLQPAVRPVRATVREVAQVAAPVALPAARELWAAIQVQVERGQAATGASPPAYAQTLAPLVQRAHAFTSRVAVEAPDAVLLELAGSQRLFGGLPALLAGLRQAFPRPLQLALAPMPLAAALLARAGRNCCITSAARLSGRLAPLSLQHLHWNADELARLANMGVVTLGQLLRLPRAGLARRIGPERLRQLDHLTGQRPDVRTAIAAAERFAEQIHPDHETADRERLLLGLQPVLVRLEEFLRARQRGVMALRLTLHHRHAAPVVCVLRCVVPEYRAARFSALLAARLEALVLREPVRRMELVAGRLRHFSATGISLWAPGEQGGDAATIHAPEFLQTLLARLGERAVYGLAVRDEHRPEQQHGRTWPLQPAMKQAAAGSVARLATAQHGTRPLGLMPEPVPLEVVCDVSGRVRQLWHARQELALISGPERIESGWWDGGDVARDYYIARTADGARWWIFRECNAPRRWFLHGCFA